MKKLFKNKLKNIAMKILSEELEDNKFDIEVLNNIASRYRNSFNVLFDLNRDKTSHTNNVIQKSYRNSNYYTGDLINGISIKRYPHLENKEIIITDKGNDYVCFVTRDGYHSTDCDNSVIKQD
jgi:hypothetical protein